MRVCVERKLFVFASVLFLVISVALVSAGPATESLVWEGLVFSSGVEVVSPVLNHGTLYRIVASGRWYYDNETYLAADAQYYTTDPSNDIFWGNHFAAPDGHSFLQINGQDKDWGDFSNGDTDHTYTIYYAGNGTAITFKIVDWLDQNHNNNECHIQVSIYAQVTVGGSIVDSNPVEASTYLAITGLVLAAAVALPVLGFRNGRRTNK